MSVTRRPPICKKPSMLVRRGGKKRRRRELSPSEPTNQLYQLTNFTNFTNFTSQPFFLTTISFWSNETDRFRKDGKQKKHHFRLDSKQHFFLSFFYFPTFLLSFSSVCVPFFVWDEQLGASRKWYHNHHQNSTKKKMIFFYEQLEEVFFVYFKYISLDCLLSHFFLKLIKFLNSIE